MKISCKNKATQKCYQGITTHNLKMVKRAIAKGADVNAIPMLSSVSNKNFLQIAVQKRNIPIIQELLETKTLDVNRYHPHTIPPLHYAIWIGADEIVGLLIDHPTIDTHLRDNYGNTCLFEAADRFGQPGLSIGKHLLDKKIDTHLTNQAGDTILHHVCKHGRAEWVELILDTDNPSIEIYNQDKHTPLHIACNKDYPFIARIILSSKHLITTQLIRSALTIALKKKYDASIDVFFNNYPNRPLFKILLSSKNNQYKQLLFEYAIRNNKVKIIKKLNYYEYINRENEQALTPLMIASRNGYNRIVTLLLQQENCIPSYQNKYKKTALHYASAGGNFKAVKQLYKYDKTQINQQDNNKNTPLHMACLNYGYLPPHAPHVPHQQKYIDIIEFLIKKNAHTLIENKDNLMPLNIIYQKNIYKKLKKETIERMIFARNESNNTVLHMLFQNRENIYIHGPDYDNYFAFILRYNNGIVHAKNNNGTILFDCNTTNAKYYSLLRASSNLTQCSLFKEALKALPKELIIIILHSFYKINIDTIFAKLYKKRLALLYTNPSRKNRIKQTLGEDISHFPLLWQASISENSPTDRGI